MYSKNKHNVGKDLEQVERKPKSTFYLTIIILWCNSQIDLLGIALSYMGNLAGLIFLH